jgi:type IV pilus assembly protein PilX
MMTDPRRGLRGERGLSLLFALLALVALSLAAAGLVRTVGGGSLAVGNLGFKLDATTSADRGGEAAIAWLQANSTGVVLDGNVTAAGYYATSIDALDATGRNTGVATRAVVDWNNDNCASVSGPYSACLDASAVNTVGGNSVSWIITRLCAVVGGKNDVTNSCAMTLSSGPADDSASGGQSYGENGGFPNTTTAPYYRIVVRSVGGRNAVSFTETMVTF